MTTPTDTRIGDVIDVLVAAKKVRKEAVQEAIGMKRSTWFRRYATESWTAQEVKQLAAFFGVSESVLFRDPADLLDTKSRFFPAVAAA